MRKKNKLYTVNKFNKPLFVSEENLFDWGGLAREAYGKKAMNSLTPWSKLSPEQQANEIENYKNSTNILGISKADNPFSKGNLAGGPKAMLSTGIGKGIASAAGGLVGNAAFQGISGGLSSGAGSAINSIGSTVGGAVGAVNPVAGAVITAASGIIGGITNAAFGKSVDQKRLNEANESIAKLNSFDGNKSSFDEIKGPEATASVEDIYQYGFLNGDHSEQEELEKRMRNAKLFANRSITNNVNNLASDQKNNALANYAAYGGPLDMGAINYDFMTDYLIAKNKKTDNNSQMTNLFAGTPSTMFAIGGDLQTNGSDFSDGLVTINAGQSHELNPNDGVQMGVDSQNVPNLVEEGETVYDDYVFSNRILADKTTKELFKLPKKKDITFADISKKLEKEISERPADPISEAGFKSMMQKLEEQQERQKQEMEAERARAAFEALSPEEQAAVMQQKAEQEAVAQQAAQEEAIVQQQTSPEEVAMTEQQMADGSQATVGQEPQVMAEGGNLYPDGGKKNAGTWKTGTSSSNWAAYTKNGLRDYLLMINDELIEAETEEEKKAIREKAIKTVNDIQKAYSEAYQSNLTPSERNAKVEALQKAFQEAGGNAYFGNISNNINMPKGHNTADTEEKGWVDGYWGPRTSIRNWGSTEYGDADYYKEIADLAAEAGLTYAPGEYKYGDNTLYQLGMAPAPAVAATDEGAPELVVDFGDNTTEGAKTLEEKAVEEKEKNYVPKLRDERLRYAGLFGPAVGLGLMAAGVGKPDTASLEAAARGAGNVHLADYQPIGDYLRYNPMDIWFEQNKLDSQARATDRGILNSGANQGSKAAALLASGLNSQIASGELYRKALEYNDALREKVAGFNRGTNQFNAEAYNRNSQFNADAKNRATQAASSLALQAAREKLDADAGWYNSLYGNIGGLFEGLANLGTENARHNMLAKMAADGVFGNTGKSYTGSTYTKEASEGGKVKKKKNKRGLTF